MMTELQQILQESWQRLGRQLLELLPNLLAMVLILAGGWILAWLIQWLLHRMSRRLDAWLRRWGVSPVTAGPGPDATARLVARSAFWIVFGCAMLMAVNALNTELGSRLVASTFLYLPRLASAAFVLVAGLLLGRFLGRGALIWAVNEGIGPARWIAGGVRVGIGLLSFVAATEQLGVARTAVLATFVVLLSGTALALALAVGLGSRKRVEQWWELRRSFLTREKEEEHIQHL